MSTLHTIEYQRLRLRQNLLDDGVGAVTKAIDDGPNGIAAIVFQHVYTPCRARQSA